MSIHRLRPKGRSDRPIEHDFIGNARQTASVEAFGGGVNGWRPMVEATSANVQGLITIVGSLQDVEARCIQGEFDGVALWVGPTLGHCRLRPSLAATEQTYKPVQLSRKVLLERLTDKLDGPDRLVSAGEWRHTALEAFKALCREFNM